jgi:hypothetical protein
MPAVKLSLTNQRHAPWGLLTDEEHPRTLVWLTETNPSGEVDSILLTDWDLSRIYQSEAAGIIAVDGLENPYTIPSGIDPNEKDPRINPVVQIDQIVAPKVQSSETIMDVTALMREEAKRAELIKSKINNSYPKIEGLLAQPAHSLKKELKSLAKDQVMVSFFQACRAKELEGKNRKTVVAVLVEIIQAKIAAVGVDSRGNSQTGQTALSDAYYDMIEEFEDEEDDEEDPSTKELFSRDLPTK